MVPSSHALARKSAVRLRETANETYVLYDRAHAPGFHDFVLGILNRAGVIPAVSQVAGEMPTLISLVASGVRAMVVPGSGAVRRQAEAEGVAHVLIEAGFESREPGCSMCLAMNDDVLVAGERCASTTNRNFEGRQGRGGRTHLMSPAMAAAAALTGRITDVRTLEVQS